MALGTSRQTGRAVPTNRSQLPLNRSLGAIEMQAPHTVGGWRSSASLASLTFLSDARALKKSI